MSYRRPEDCEPDVPPKVDEELLRITLASIADFLTENINVEPTVPEGYLCLPIRLDEPLTFGGLATISKALERTRLFGCRWDGRVRTRGEGVHVLEFRPFQMG